MPCPNFIATLCSLLSNFFTLAPVQRFLRRSVYAGSLLSLSVYAWVRILLHDFPPEPLREAGMLLEMIVAGCCLTGICIGGFSFLMLVADHITVARRTVTRMSLKAAVVSKFTQPPAIASNHYNILLNESNIAIDKTGRFRYRVTVIKPGMVAAAGSSLAGRVNAN